MRKIVGITGGIACGKSTLSEMLISKGYNVINCDKINRELLENDNEVLKAIERAFGEKVIVNSAISRKKLADIVFNDEEKREELNAIMHPRIRTIVINKIGECTNDIIFIEVPLLFESDFYKLCTYTVVVYVDLNTQLARLRKRDELSFIDALTRIRALSPIEEKIKKADFVIDNRHRIEDLSWQIDQLLCKLKVQE